MLKTLIFILVVWPFLAGAGIYFLRAKMLRNLLVIASAGMVANAAFALSAQGAVSIGVESFFGFGLNGLIMIADFALLGVMFFYGWKHQHKPIMGMVAVQAVMLFVIEFFMISGMDHSYPAFVNDNLSSIMVLIISLVGGIICIHAIPYMQEHENHLHLETTRQPRFFAILVLFLGAMNGLVLANDFLTFYFFFEVTTFCSFLLIGHDGTEIAIKNSLKALWMNCLGGVALLLGIGMCVSVVGTLDIQALIASGTWAGKMIFPLALIVFAGFTKAAQFPFQSWLLGAMVAPTPTSALLHSSTMVKAGVYLVLRFAPAFAGTFLSLAVAGVGAFTFLAGAYMCIGQSNGKKILAYSTVSNLGLIIACAGINTPTAITAATMLIIFHAVSKALLFLCVGTVEQAIGSRDVEDMRGLYATLPRTTLIMVIGVLTMILPPFGMLLGKWMAIESASVNIFIISMLALGSALTVLYWARWAGGLMGTTVNTHVPTEEQSILTSAPLAILCGSAVLLSAVSPLIYNKLIAPAMQDAPYETIMGVFTNSAGAFVVYPLFLLIAGGLYFAIRNLRNQSGGQDKQLDPYMCGLNTEDPTQYIGPMDAPVQMSNSNYYMEKYFGEAKLTPWVNYVAGLLLLMVLGGAL
ncbi:MAG: NADH-quinone oxidoreductase subunit L [Desulfovibrio sp.]